MKPYIPVFKTKLLKEDVTLLWKCGYWDGVLSGFLVWKDNVYWFEHFCENPDRSDDRWYRRYGLYRVTKKEWIQEKIKHAEFQRFVGYNTDYNISLPEGIPLLKPQENWNKYYDKYKNSKPKNYKKRALIAILEM